MAQRAVHQTTGNAGRIVHWLVPSRRQLALGMAVEVAVQLLGLPLLVHLGLAVAAHVLVGLLDE